MNPKVDWFFEQDTPWKAAYKALRSTLLDCQLDEELKWGKPCYTYNGNNVVLIHGFKHYCALLFHKGALLKDPEGILVQQTKNVQAARQIRFDSVDEVKKLEKSIKAYVFEAIEVEKAGLEVKMKKTSQFEMAEEFKQKLEEMPGLKKAFYALTPGRQRGYLLHFSQPKQSKTRSSRVEKCIPAILVGKGLNDR